MKTIKYVVTLLALCLTFHSQAQNPDDIVCVVLAPDLVIPVTLEEAEELNLDIVECDDYDIVTEGNNPSDCDCDWDTAEVVCASIFGEIFQLHPCELQCGFIDAFVDIEVVDCESLVFGCTDENATNYDESATANDGSCEYDWNEECDCDWQTDEFICVDFGWGEISQVHPCELECFGEWFGEEYDIIDCNDLVYGCTDASATNYDQEANINDGSCEYEWIDECDCDWGIEEYVCINVVGTSDVFTIHACDLECGFFVLMPECVVVDCDEVVFGCTDPDAENYDENATANDGSCEYEWEVEECDCDWETDEVICVDFGWGEISQLHPCELECYGEWFGDTYEIIECEDLVYGCTDPSATNYSQEANINDGSCEYEWVDECDCDWSVEDYVCINVVGTSDVFTIHACDLECGFFVLMPECVVVDCDEVVFGCTDPDAENYDENATANDGSCEYDWEVEECDCDWESEEIVCVTIEGSNEVFTLHACELECYGEEFFFEGLELVDCGEVIFGCTDPNAENYDENATANDGSCEYEWEVEECDCDWDTDEFVCVDFGFGQVIEIHACELECYGDEFEEIEIVECSSENNDEEDNEDIEEDVLEAIEDFIAGGQFNQENFLDLGNIIMELVLFPNPIGEEGMGVYIESNSESSAFIQVTNSLGQVVLKENTQLQSGANQLEIDVRGLESGIYTTTVITNGGASISERFIKK